MLPVSAESDHVTVWAGLLVPLTVAVNCWVPPLATVAEEGVTVTPVTVGVAAGAGTVTVAVPLLVVSTVDIAFIVSVASVSSADTVRSPLALMVVPLCLDVSTIDHVTV